MSNGDRNLKLEDIQAFVAVVRNASITAAADALLIGQPAVTRRVQSLERELGVALLDRNVKPSRPTEVGRRVYELCVNVVRDIRLIDELVGDGCAQSDLPLRIGIAEVLAEIALLNAMSTMHIEYPELELEIASGWSTDLIRRLRAHAVDAAVVVLPESNKFDPEIDATAVGTLPMVVVAKKGLVRGRKRLADLHGLEWVLNPEGCGFRDLLQGTLSAQGLPLAIKVSTFGTEQKLGLVARGAGIAFVPAIALDGSRYAPELQRIDLVDFEPRPCIWLLQPRSIGRSTDCVERFGSAILDELEAHGSPIGKRKASSKHVARSIKSADCV